MLMDHMQCVYRIMDGYVVRLCCSAPFVVCTWSVCLFSLPGLGDRMPRICLLGTQTTQSHNVVLLIAGLMQ